MNVTSTRRDPFAVYDEADIDRARQRLADISAHLDGGPGDRHVLLVSAEVTLKSLLRIIDHRAGLGQTEEAGL